MLSLSRIPVSRIARWWEGNIEKYAVGRKHNSSRKMWRGWLHGTSLLTLSKIGKSEGKTSLRSYVYRWYNVIKILKIGCRLDSYGLEHGPVVGCCEYGNESLVVHKRWGICWPTEKISASKDCLMRHITLGSLSSMLHDLHMWEPDSDPCYLCWEVLMLHNCLTSGEQVLHVSGRIQPFVGAHPWWYRWQKTSCPVSFTPLLCDLPISHPEDGDSILLWNGAHLPYYIQTSIPLGKCQDNTSNQAITSCFYNVFSPLIMLLLCVRAADNIVK
jgi:hypothetical protein